MCIVCDQIRARVTSILVMRVHVYVYVYGTVSRGTHTPHTESQREKKERKNHKREKNVCLPY